MANSYFARRRGGAHRGKKPAKSAYASIKFNDRETLKFVELYESEECLWNQHIQEYKNKESRDAALERLVSEMDIQDFGPKEVLRKINNIRSTYKQELLKIKNGDENGSPYTPRLYWFQAAHRFLPKVMDTLGVTFVMDQENDVKQEPSTSRTAPPYIQNVSLASPERSDRKRRLDPEPAAERRSVHLKRSEGEGPPRVVKEPDDEFTHFGRNVAYQLRKLPIEDALQAQTEILQILLDRRLLFLHQRDEAMIQM